MTAQPVQPLAPSQPSVSGPVAASPVSAPAQPVGATQAAVSPDLAQKVQASLSGSQDAGSFFSKLSPSDKAMLLSAGVQGIGGAAGGLFGGLGQADQVKLGRFVAEEQFKRGGYAPEVSFQNQGGLINTGGR